MVTRSHTSRSSQFPGNFELDSEEKIKYYVGTIRNFLNYLLHHDVCPEYNDQINGARVICDKAVGQLWTISQCTPLLPGDFNTACSEIFGGMYHGMYSADMDWMAGMELDHQCGISPEQARSVFKYALAANADEAVFETYKNQLKEKNCSITSTEDTGLDVVEISFADAETLSLYARPECAGLAPVGKLKAKTWINPTTLDEDLTEEEEAALASAVPEIKYYEFWVEDKVLQKCFVGMKLEATVTQLSFGVFYFDAIYGVHCSFYQVLPNKLMRDWREPEKEWLPPRKKFEQHSSEDLDYQEEAAGSRESKPTNNNAVEEQEKVDMDDETAATQDLGASAGPAKQVVEENLEKDQDQGSNGVE